jgi:type VI secretion system secreted protein Hcp
MIKKVAAVALLVVIFMAFGSYTMTLSAVNVAQENIVNPAVSAIYTEKNFTTFLKIDGIEGESNDSAHLGEIDVNSFSWGENRAGGGSGDGNGTGKVNMNDFSITMAVSKASPKLFLACATGEHIKSALLTARKDNNASQEYLKWSFTDIQITSYSTSANTREDEKPIEQITFSFGKISIEYKEIRSNGTLGPSTTAGWDLKNNKPK